jgi:hypothetical protein
MLPTPPRRATTQDLVSPSRAEWVRTRLSELNHSAGELIIENGLLLLEMKKNGYHRELGYKSFDDCLTGKQQRGEIDYGPRQARNFLNIVALVNEVGLSSGDLDTIAISKLREIATLPASTDEKRDFLERAKGMSVAEVQAEAKRRRDKHFGHDTDPIKPFPLNTSDTQRQFLVECLQKARRVYAIDNAVSDTSVLVDAILPEWFTSAAADDLPPQTSSDETDGF